MSNIYSLLASGTAAIILGAASGVAIHLVRKAYKEKKSPLHVETTEFPEQPESAEVNPADGEKIAAAVKEAEAKAEEKAETVPEVAPVEEAKPEEQPKEEVTEEPKEEAEEEPKATEEEAAEETKSAEGEAE